MASIVYNSAVDDTVKGNIDFNTDTFKAMLVTSSYSPDKDAHTVRANVTNEIVGTGYTTGGVTVSSTVTKNTDTDRVDIEFSNPSWTNSTLVARGCVIYKSTGTASADPLVAFVDFINDVTTTNGTFQVNFTSPLRFQN